MMSGRTRPALAARSMAAVLFVALLTPGAAPAGKFTHHTGALDAGGDLGAVQNLSTPAAIAHCTSRIDCSGFTFPCAGGAARCPATSATPVKTYFKAAGTAGNSDEGWWTYTKEQEHLLAYSFGSHMVLQHELPCLFGFGKAGTAVSIRLNETVVKTAGGETGISLAPPFHPY